jgi:hypothetical protein
VRRGDDLAYVPAVANVTDNGLDLTAGSLHFIGGLTEAVWRNVIRDDRCSRTCKCHGTRAAETRAGSGDSCDLAR